MLRSLPSQIQSVIFRFNLFQLTAYFPFMIWDKFIRIMLFDQLFFSVFCSKNLHYLISDRKLCFFLPFSPFFIKHFYVFCKVKAYSFFICIQNASFFSLFYLFRSSSFESFMASKLDLIFQFAKKIKKTKITESISFFFWLCRNDFISKIKNSKSLWKQNQKIRQKNRHPLHTEKKAHNFQFTLFVGKICCVWVLCCGSLLLITQQRQVASSTKL